MLAIKIKRVSFDELLSKAVLSNHDNQVDVKSSDVVLQWDPDHEPNGAKVSTGRRAIQLGIRGETLQTFSKNYIEDVVDMTDFCQNQYNKCKVNGEAFKDLSGLVIPREKVYMPASLDVARRINLTF